MPAVHPGQKAVRSHSGGRTDCEGQTRLPSRGLAAGQALPVKRTTSRRRAPPG